MMEMAVPSIDASATDNEAELRRLSVILGDVPVTGGRPDAESLFRSRVGEHGERVRRLRDSVSPLFV